MPFDTKEEAEAHLRSLVVDPAQHTADEYKRKSSILLPRLVYKGSFVSPAYQTEQSSCFDFIAEKETEIYPGNTVIIPTGCYLTLENAQLELQLNPAIMNIALVIRPRSSIAAKGLIVGAGEVDRDYLVDTNDGNEIKVILHYLNREGSDKIVIKAGDRFAQGKWDLNIRDPFLEVKSKVRSGGFGSTEKGS